MDHDANDSCLPIDAYCHLRTGDALTEMMRVLAGSFQSAVPFERRRHPRTGLPFLLKFVPLDEAGRPLPHEETVVVGKDISERGLSFFHPRPIPYRRGQVTLEHPQAGRFTVEVELRRCRFHRLGWYESGGRLVRAIELLFPRAAQVS